jgi:hypothetical protein
MLYEARAISQVGAVVRFEERVPGFSSKRTAELTGVGHQHCCALVQR